MSQEFDKNFHEQKKLGSLAQFCEEEIIEDFQSEYQLDKDFYKNVEIVELIAEGGFKNIYKARDPYSNRFIAMGVLKLSKLDMNNYEAFIKEAYLLSSLDHPNIISVHQIGETDEKLPYYTMDYLQGESLDKIIQDESYKDWDFSQKIDLFVDICSAIQYSHKYNILHLDIKPSNIFITQGKQPVLLDWGLSKMSKVSSSKPFDSFVIKLAKAKVIGTLGYMSPEQAQGMHHLVDERTDIFSLGALFYSLIYRTSFFHSTMTSEIIKETKEVDLYDWKQLISEKDNVPINIKHIIKKCLAQKKNDRYQNVSALINDIHRYNNKRLTKAEPQKLVSKLNKWWHRQKYLLYFISLILFFSIGMLYIYKVSTKHQIDDLQLSQEKLEKIKKILENFTLSMNEKEHFSAYELFESNQVEHAISLINLKKASKHTLSEEENKLLMIDAIMNQKINEAFEFAKKIKSEELINFLVKYRHEGQKTKNFSVDEYLNFIREFKVFTDDWNNMNLLIKFCANIDLNNFSNDQRYSIAKAITDESKKESFIKSILETDGGFNLNTDFAKERIWSVVMLPLDTVYFNQWSVNSWHYILANSKHIKKIILRGDQTHSFKYVHYAKLDSLDAKQSNLNFIGSFNLLQHLKELDIRENKNISLSNFHKFSSLKKLYCDHEHILNFSPEFRDLISELKIDIIENSP